MEIYTEIEIAASCEQVWQILTNLNAYSSWNPFLTKAQGEIKLGQSINMTAEPPGFIKMSFSPRIVKVEENKEFRWKGKMLVPGLFDGEHVFIIEKISEQKVRLVHKENYSGFVILLLKLFSLQALLNESTQKGFNSMNQAVK